MKTFAGEARMKTFAGIAAASALLAVFWGQPARADYTFTSFGDPNDPGANIRTGGINNAGQVVGWAGNVDEDFVRNADGTANSFYPSGAIRPKAASINNAGTILVTDDLGHQVLISQNGGNTFSTAYTNASIPNSTQVTGSKINDNGLIVGSYNDAQFNPHGLIFDTNTGKATTVDYQPGGSIFTGLNGINNSGVVVGGFYDSSVNNPQTHGLIYDNGKFTVFDPTGSVTTAPSGINNLGVIAGIYYDANNVERGFVRAADGTYSSFGIADMGFANETSFSVTGINDGGELVGWWRDSNGNTQGFTATPNASAVPEPTSLALLGVGLAVASAVRHRSTPGTDSPRS